MKYIYIFGASGFAREIYFLVKDTKEYVVEAFVDKNEKSDNYINIDSYNIPVISESSFMDICHNNSKIHAVIAIADTKITSHIISKFNHKCIFPNIIHPSCIAFSPLDIGIGNIITIKCMFSDKITIGSFNRFNTGCLIGHDVNIGNNNHFNPECKISGEVKIGNNNFFGVNAVVLQGLKIEDSNVIGASSLLAHNIKSNKTYLGVPAQIFEF